MIPKAISMISQASTESSESFSEDSDESDSENGIYLPDFWGTPRGPVIIRRDSNNSNNSDDSDSSSNADDNNGQTASNANYSNRNIPLYCELYAKLFRPEDAIENSNTTAHPITVPAEDKTVDNFDNNSESLEHDRSSDSDDRDSSTLVVAEETEKVTNQSSSEDSERIILEALWCLKYIFQCKRCKYTTNSLKLIEKHVSCKNFLVKCSYCEFASDKITMRIHEKLHVDCRFKIIYFENSVGLQKYYYYQCDDCLVLFTQHHECKRLSGKQCEICQYSFLAQCFLQHMKCHEEDENMTGDSIVILPVNPLFRDDDYGEDCKTLSALFKCYECNCLFLDGEEYFHHKVLQECSYSRSILCNKCDYLPLSFNKKYTKALEFHTERHALAEGSEILHKIIPLAKAYLVQYQCTNCKVHFDSEASHRCDSDSAKCDKCGLMFEQSALKEHIDRHNKYTLKSDDFCIFSCEPDKNERCGTQQVNLNDVKPAKKFVKSLGPALEDNGSEDPDHGSADSDNQTNNNCNTDVIEHEKKKSRNKSIDGATDGVETGNFKASNAYVHSSSDTKVVIKLNTSAAVIKASQNETSVTLKKRSTEAVEDLSATHSSSKSGHVKSANKKVKKDDQFNGQDGHKAQNIEGNDLAVLGVVKIKVKTNNKDYMLFQCQPCNVHFQKLESCLNHVKNHTPLGDNEYLNCKFCDWLFYIYDLAEHMSTQNCRDKKSFRILNMEKKSSHSSNISKKKPLKNRMLK